MIGLRTRAEEAALGGKPLAGQAGVCAAVVGAFWLILLNCCAAGVAMYEPSEHIKVPPGSIAVTGPGNCDQPGKVYVLTQDISSNTTPLFLGNDVTLDLNGYTVTYAAGGYEHIPNYGFEEGLARWEVSKAPSARTEDTDKVKPFIGRKILRLSKGEEIASEYITLPVAKRSYNAMCGVLSKDMEVTISVDDEKGEPVKCVSSFGESGRQTCPQTGSPKLGGGFVFAWIHDLPAGKYRIRVKAESDCLIDEVDIRPAMDVGVGIVETVQPWARYRNVLNMDFPAFTDYAKTEGSTEPVEVIARVQGPGTIIIRNGVIRSGAEGIRSWAVLSTARDVKLVLENVSIVTAGINANAVHAPRATIRDCRFETGNPFIIDRHNQEESPVSLFDANGSEVSDSEFIGGQGNLFVAGDKDILIHDNLFVNRQTVTNHYSVMLAASNARVYRNRFLPEIGSGIITGARNNEIYENTFEITAADGSCEYTNTNYSTNAIRITDYYKDPGSPDGAFGNRVHHNTIHVRSRDRGTYADFIPVANAVVVTVGAGTNYVYQNDITVEIEEPRGRAEAYGCYVSGPNGGEYRENRITTNGPAFWIGHRDAPGANVRVIRNTITKSANAPANYKPFRLGFWEFGATNIEFVENRFVNCEFGVDAAPGVEIKYTVR